MKIYREIIPIMSKDVFGIFNCPKAIFEYPLHNHPEYEINLILKASGNRTVGDKVEKYEDCDLVLLGPYLNHCWDISDTDKIKYPNTHNIVIQFEENLFQNSILSKDTFQDINMMLNYSLRGIVFFGETRNQAIQKILQLVDLEPFERTIKILELLQMLATSKENRLISRTPASSKINSPESKKMNKVYNFIMANYHKKITAPQVAGMINMSESAFSHFFKKSTNKSFTKFLTEIRLSKVCIKLIGTQDTVSEICYQCGYTNLSNFNRLFKKYKGMTPLRYRQQAKYNVSNLDKKYI